MRERHFLDKDALAQTGEDMHRLMGELYPICRSITGDGVRKTLNILSKDIPINVKEVASGTEVFDWTVPKEWNITDAYVKNQKGVKIIDLNDSTLHILNYSIPVHKKVSLAELKRHLFTLPEHPDWIPYKTSYYNESWGFCISHNQLEKLEQGEYEVYIDASLKNGFLTYGECYIQGETIDEVLISTHICHPSLCNDNLSGIVLAKFLAEHLAKSSLKYSYRFLFIPGTIGSISWLYLNEANLSSIKHGFVITCAGDSGKFTYKKTRRGNLKIDSVFSHALRESKRDFDVIDFFPYGYDERQYCSPGFDLPVGCIMRTPHGQFPEYHTSGDNLDFVTSIDLADSYSMLLAVCNILENDATYVNQNPKCEPQLGKRGLYQKIGGQNDSGSFQMAMLWVLNLSDGMHSLLDISERSKLAFDLIKDAADVLAEKGLLKEFAGKNDQ
jgi:aminopeptidase-like protein